MSSDRIFLSPPHLSGAELDYLSRSLASNWIAPGGPYVREFERIIAGYLQVGHAMAVSSGTAALHLAHQVLEVSAGDTVICPTFTYIASVNPTLYVAATPYLVDCEPDYWQMSPCGVELAIESCLARGRAPKAVLVADNYGQTADYRQILAICDKHALPVIEDAAQSLGACFRDKPAGSLGRLGVLSFNGNKIITASGGGMLVSNDGELIARARYLANQASDPNGYYHHSEIGFNYGFSNVLAALGCAQFDVLPARLAARKRNFDYYQQALAQIPGFTFMPPAMYGTSNHWLNCLRVDPKQYGASRDDVIKTLAKERIEARPTWVPVHRQPAFSGFPSGGGNTAEQISADGLCLPSGSNLSADDLERIVNTIIRLHESVVSARSRSKATARRIAKNIADRATTQTPFATENNSR